MPSKFWDRNCKHIPNPWCAFQCVLACGFCSLWCIHNQCRYKIHQVALQSLMIFLPLWHDQCMQFLLSACSVMVTIFLQISCKFSLSHFRESTFPPSIVKGVCSDECEINCSQKTWSTISREGKELPEIRGCQNYRGFFTFPPKGKFWSSVLLYFFGCVKTTGFWGAFQISKYIFWDMYSFGFQFISQ